MKDKRFKLAGMGSACYLVTPFLVRLTDADPSDLYNALLALLALITVAVGGDTMRPSGAAFPPMGGAGSAATSGQGASQAP